MIRKEIYVLVIFLVLHQSSEQIHSFDYSSILGNVNIEIDIGTPMKRKYFEADLIHNLTYINNNFYRESYTKINHGRGVCSHEGNNNVSYLLLSDCIKITNQEKDRKNFEHFYFYFFNQTFYQFDSISFGKDISDKRLSIVYQLYENNLIQKKQFSFINDANNKNGHIYLGGLPSHITKGLYSTTMKTESSLPTWAANLNKITFGNNNKEYIPKNKEYVMFYTYSKTYAPSTFFDFLEETLFKEYIDKEQCTRTRYKNKLNIFECDCDILDYLPRVSFVIDNKYFEFDKSLLYFRTLQDKCRLKIEETIYDNENEWRIGFEFLEMYPTIFDYDTKSITIYNKFKYPQNEKKSLVYLYIFFSCVNILMIIILCYNKVKKNY